MAFLDKQTFLAGFTNPLGFAKVFVSLAPIAADPASVHPSYSAASGNTFPGPITNPDVPRNLQVALATGWDGGDVTVTGTDQFDAAVSETFTTGSNVTRIGSKIFKTVTSVTKASVGTTGTATVGTGNKLGIVGLLVNSTSAILLVDNNLEGATLDATYNGFTPISIPDNSRSYALIANVSG